MKPVQAEPNLLIKRDLCLLACSKHRNYDPICVLRFA